MRRITDLAPSLAALVLAAAAAGCTLHSHGVDFNGVDGIRGQPIEYQETSTYSLGALWIFDLLGDTSIENGVGEFTDEAASRGATRTQITYSTKSVYWWVLPPISFFIHPMGRFVQGEVEGSQVIQ